ncbi:MAG: hypothetical protein V2J25_13705 [Desulfatiglans sp.]|jgi:hypothetical protein|nr:hypothetical protein [Desulfatiglans sp.]
MGLKHIIFFILAVGISLLGSAYRWGDSAHSIGLIHTNGGRVKHPSFLKSGKSRYAFISTATVMPPYSGDARLVLEGEPEMDYELSLSRPIVDLGFRRLPKFDDNVLYDLTPRDRLAIWIVIKPKDKDAACGKQTLAFYDTKTSRPLLRVPMIFRGKEDSQDAYGCCR